MLIMDVKQRTSVRITTDAHRTVRMVAADRGVTVQDVLDEILDRWAVGQAILVLKSEDMTAEQRNQLIELLARSARSDHG